MNDREKAFQEKLERRIMDAAGIINRSAIVRLAAQLHVQEQDQHYEDRLFAQGEQIARLMAQVEELQRRVEFDKQDDEDLHAINFRLQEERDDARAKVQSLTEDAAKSLPSYSYSPRGIGRNWLPCFVCGSGYGQEHPPLVDDMAAFVRSREDGLAVVALFHKGLAMLDYREREPNWIQVKVGACEKHKANLEFLMALTSPSGRIDAAKVASALLYTAETQTLRADLATAQRERDVAVRAYTALSETDDQRELADLRARGAKAEEALTPEPSQEGQEKRCQRIGCGTLPCSLHGEGAKRRTCPGCGTALKVDALGRCMCCGAAAHGEGAK